MRRIDDQKSSDQPRWVASCCRLTGVGKRPFAQPYRAIHLHGLAVDARKLPGYSGGRRNNRSSHVVLLSERHLEVTFEGAITDHLRGQFRPREDQRVRHVQRGIARRPRRLGAAGIVRAPRGQCAQRRGGRPAALHVRNSPAVAISRARGYSARTGPLRPRKQALVP